MSSPNKLFHDLAILRYVIVDGGKARRHRFSIIDRLERDKVLARFDEFDYAEKSLNQYRESYIHQLIGELANEHFKSSLSFTEARQPLHGLQGVA